MQHEPSSLLATAEVIHWVALAVMAAIAAGLLLYFRRKGWLGRPPLSEDISKIGGSSRARDAEGERRD